MLIRLRGCPGWSASLLFAYGINTCSHDVDRIYLVNMFLSHYFKDLRFTAFLFVYLQSLVSWFKVANIVVSLVYVVFFAVGPGMFRHMVVSPNY